MAEKIIGENSENRMENNECSASKCITDDNLNSKDTLTCRKCKRVVHYGCSGLPAYQIQLCLTFKTRCFQCQNCVNILPEIQEKVERGRKSKIEKLEREIKACENIIKAQREQIDGKISETAIRSNIKEQVNVKNEVEQRIEGIELKIDEILNKINVPETKDHPSNKESYAQALSKNAMTRNEFKTILQEKTIEERKIISTESNIIIHGLLEFMDDTEEELKQNDKRRVANTLKAMGINVEFTKIERIGIFTKEREDHERYRPIKVHLESKEAKIKVLKNLKKLKSVDLRITEDLTKQERKLVKEWSDQAKKKNDENTDKSFKWRVRGSPRCGLYLKKVFCNTSGS